MPASLLSSCVAEDCGFIIPSLLVNSFFFHLHKHDLSPIYSDFNTLIILNANISKFDGCDFLFAFIYGSKILIARLMITTILNIQNFV